MKLTIFLSLFLCLQVAGKTSAQIINLDVKSSSLKSVLRSIQRQTDYSFVVSEDVLKRAVPITIKIKEKHIKEALPLLFANQTIDFEIANKVIVLKDRGLWSAVTFSQKKMEKQQINIIGSVMNEEGEPMGGVNITVQGDTRGVVTDLNGKFIIRALPTDKLIFTFLGMESQTVEVDQRRMITVIMKKLADQLEEVTVIGYGQQKKESVVASLNSIGPKELTIKQRNLRNVLAGQIAGVIAVQRSGEPGNDAAAFYIRGQSSYAGGTSPLVLVDGVPRRMDDIDVDEIETFTVLKDAAATAVYGAEGANGVVLITSKRGKIQKTLVNFSAQQSKIKPKRLMKLMDSYSYLSLFNEALWNNQGNPDKSVFQPQYTDEILEKYRTGADQDLYPSVNWMDLVSPSTRTTRYTTSFRGGSEKTRFFTSGAYFKEDGIFKSNTVDDYNANIGLERFNLRSNVDLDLTKSTKLSVDMSGQYVKRNQPGYSSDQIFEYISHFPVHVIPMIYSDGTASDHGAYGARVEYQPYNMLNNSGYSKTWSSYLQTKVNLQQDLHFLTEGLSTNGVVSFDADFSSSLVRSKTATSYFALARKEDGSLDKKMMKEGAVLGNPAQGSRGGSKKIYLETSLNYKRTFNQLHDVTALILYMQKETQSQSESDGLQLLPFRKQSVVARATYGFDTRYLFEASMGITGSENFAEGHRWGAFPAVGAAWYISNEKFMKGLQKHINKLKIRGSYGITGNDNIGSARFPYRESINTGAPGYGFGLTPGAGGGSSNSPGAGIAEGSFPMPGLTWEIERKINAGLDLGLFKGRIDLSVDYFHNRRTDILLQRRTVSNVTGFRTFPYQNYGTVENKGIDGNLILKQKVGAVNLSARGNFTFARNKILEYDEIPQRFEYQNYTGNPIGQPYLYIADGLYTPDDFDITVASNGSQSYQLKPGFAIPSANVSPGDLKYKDLNGDGVIDSYDQTYDNKFYGQLPEIVYGFGLNAEWKGLFVGVFFQGTAHASTNMLAEAGNLIPFSSGVDNGSSRIEVADRWTAENPYNQNVFMPRLHATGFSQNSWASTWWYRDASFLRLKNIEVGYDFDKKIIKRLKMNNLRVYLQGTNIAVWDKIKFWDPELGNANSGAKYPLSSTYSVGLEVTL
ncbi:MAG: TonB-dependent receptor [Sphingobacterium sp.]|nr:TonB-dependent receptor [Sphingobacterium sp.]